MRFKKILRSPKSTNHSLNARSPLGNDERSFAVRGALRQVEIASDKIRVPHELWPRLPNWQFCGLSALRSMPFEVDRSIFSDSVLGRTRLSESSQSFNQQLNSRLDSGFVTTLSPALMARLCVARVRQKLPDYAAFDRNVDQKSPTFTPPQSHPVIEARKPLLFIHLNWCREGELNPHGFVVRRILSPLRLPVPPSRQGCLNGWSH
jgi:hypothetical protein